MSIKDPSKTEFEAGQMMSNLSLHSVTSYLIVRAWKKTFTSCFLISSSRPIILSLVPTLLNGANSLSASLVAVRER